MRVSVDLDDKNPLKWLVTYLKGLYYCQRFPTKMRRTTKGIHIIWSGLPINFQRSIELRLKIGDDKNRVNLDLISDKRISQVLFDEKVTTCYGFMMTSFCKKVGIDPHGKDLTRCPNCGKNIDKAVDYRSKEKNCVEVYHGKTFCQFQPKRKWI